MKAFSMTGLEMLIQKMNTTNKEIEELTKQLKKKIKEQELDLKKVKQYEDYYQQRLDLR